MNHLYYGDNLSVMREHLADASVDLVYLDPPFNSNASYNVLFKAPEGSESAAQIEAFDDTWAWGQTAEDAYREVQVSGNTDAAEMLRAIRGFLGENAMMAYLAMMAIRLIELHRVLKPTGSLYLHCDPTASHYLKILLDAVFGSNQFLSEISWKRTGTHSSAKRWGPVHDTLFFYSKGGDIIWNKPLVPHSEKHLKSHYRKLDKDGRKYEHGELTGAGTRKGRSGDPWRGFDVTKIGRHWVTTVENLEKIYQEGKIYIPEGGGWPRLIRYEDESKGRVVGDFWEDIPPINMRAKERLGYPTQKPVALLERIVAASSNPGDVVLDPFCGCGTTVHASEKLGRTWTGIDITHLAIGLIERRLREAFPGIQFRTHGVPKDLGGARELFQRDDSTKKEFEKWAVSLLPNAQPWRAGKKGADKGIDGVMYLGKADRALISVKGGKVTDAMIRDLVGVLDREKAQMGIFVTLEEPTKPMQATAVAAGHWTPEGFDPIPRVQIATIESLLASPVPPLRLPLVRSDTYRKAAREERASDQGDLDL